MQYVLHDADGNITQYSTMPDELYEAFEPPPELFKLPTPSLPGGGAAFLSSHYVLDGAVVPRKAMSVNADKRTIYADGADIVTLSGLPEPCTVLVSGVIQAGPVIVEAGTLEISCDHPGRLEIMVTAGSEWIPWKATINAT